MAPACKPIDEWPAGVWIAHKRETWPFQFATLNEDVQFKEWHGHGANPEFTYRNVPEGTKVRIVMVSRFGDVGITDKLERETGYNARVCLSKLR